MNTVCAPIKKRFPAIARLLESVPALVEVSVARSGKVTGRLGNVRLSSEYDPEREALTFVSKQGISDADHVALYGVGMGHHLQPLLDAVGPDGRVMAVEANLSILKAALMQADNQPAFLDDRLCLVAGGDETELLDKWQKAFGALDPARSKVVIHQPSFQLVPENFPKVINAVELVRMERRFPVVMGDAVKENFRRNMDRVLRAGALAKMRGTAKGGAVAVVGAGPSLDRTILHLSAFREQMTILSSDTALPVLLNAGVAPDLVFTADPQDATQVHFNLAGRLDLPLVILPTSNSGVVQAWEGPLFCGFPGPGNLPEPARSWAIGMGEVKSGGSVSCLALETALAMGAQTVFLFGQDFGYPGGLTYSSGSAPAICGAVPLADEEILVEKNYFGVNVKTSRNLYSYMRDFEKLAQSARARILTLSPDGVAIAGIEPVASPAPWLTGAKRPVDFSMLCKATVRPGPEVRRALMAPLSK